MEVMTLHKWFDEDVESVHFCAHKNNRRIFLKSSNEGSLIINKEDVVALAKEFDLVVYPKDAKL